MLYTASSADYFRGYQMCFSEHPEAKFVVEHNFENQTRYWLRLGGPDDPVSFLVDDDVFYRDCPYNAELRAANGWGLPLSLRGGDYDYPFSVDGNIYRRFHVETLTASYRFRDPTELEARGHELRALLPFQEVNPVLPPCLVGVPANRVSTRSGMPHMGVDPRGLNERYLEGGRLDVELLASALTADGIRDLPAHEALDYTWDGVLV